MEGASESGSLKAGWAHFPHVADVGVHGFGPDPETAFEQTAVAMTAIVTEPGDIRVEDTVDIHCSAPDLEILLADWLNAIVFEMATRGMLFREFQVEIDGRELRGRAAGEAVDRARHQPAAEVKGATLSELQVRRADDGLWHARCVVDV